MKARRDKMTIGESVTKPAKLQAGAGRWLLLLCEAGHLIKQFPHGDWSDARKKYGGKKATVDCRRCV